MVGGMPAQKAENFGPSAKRLVGRLSRKPWAISSWSCMVVIAVRPAMSVGPQDPGPGHRPDLRRRGRQAAARRAQQGTRSIDGLRRQGKDKVADMLSGMDTRARARASTSTRSAACCSLVLAVYVVGVAARVAAGLPPQRRRAGDRLPDALRVEDKITGCR